MRGDKKEFPAASTIMVQPIDLAKFESDVREFLKDKFDLPEKIEIRGGDRGLIECHGQIVRVDSECCWSLDSDNKDGFAFDIFKAKEEKIGEDGKKSWSISMFPITVLRMKGEHLKEYLKPAVSLKDFMGQRFDYNQRIRSNMEYFINYVETGKE